MTVTSLTRVDGHLQKGGPIIAVVSGAQQMTEYIYIYKDFREYPAWVRLPFSFDVTTANVKDP